MKKTFLAFMMMAVTFTASADNLKGGITNLVANEMKQDAVTTHEDSVKTSSEIYVGWNSAINGASNMDTKIMKSWDLMLTTGGDVKLGKNSPFAVNISLGVEWKNFRMTGNHMFVKDEESNVAVVDVPEGENINFSRIRTFGIVLPVMLKANINKNTSIAVGPMLSYVPFGTILTEYSDNSNDTRMSSRTKHIHQNEWAVDIMGKFKYKSVGLYVKYSPTSVIKKKFAPGTDFQSLSFGVVLGK